MNYAFRYAFKYALLKITGLPLVKNVHKPLAKFVLISLWLSAAASELDAAIQKKLFGSERNFIYLVVLYLTPITVPIYIYIYIYHIIYHIYT